MTASIIVDTNHGIHDADWYLSNSRGEFLSEREAEDVGELGVFYAPIPAETVQLSEEEE